MPAHRTISSRTIIHERKFCRTVVLMTGLGGTLAWYGVISYSMSTSVYEHTSIYGHCSFVSDYLFRI